MREGGPSAVEKKGIGGRVRARRTVVVSNDGTGQSTGRKNGEGPGDKKIQQKDILAPGMRAPCLGKGWRCISGDKTMRATFYGARCDWVQGDCRKSIG